jgi:hypothetical protein
MNLARLAEALGKRSLRAALGAPERPPSADAHLFEPKTTLTTAFVRR